MTISVNSKEQTVGSGCSVQTLLDQLGFTQKRVAVEVNQELVTKSQWENVRLRDGDKVEIVTFRSAAAELLHSSFVTRPSSLAWNGVRMSSPLFKTVNTFKLGSVHLALAAAWSEPASIPAWRSCGRRSKRRVATS